MSNVKNRFLAFIKRHSALGGTILLILVASVLLWHNHVNSNQSLNAVMAKIRFEGEYRIGDGPWQEIIAGEHISSTKGDVTLRGNFHLYFQGDEYIGPYDGDTPLAFYTNHINLTFFEEGQEPVTIDQENPMFGASFCGIDWNVHTFSSNSAAPIEILIHNQHHFGNETAIDEMLSSISVWDGIVFERTIYNSGQTQRNIALSFVILSFMLLGSALFSALLNIKNNRIMWLLGAAILSAGTYLLFNAPGLPFDSENTAFNTTMLGFSMIFYMLFISGIITHFLQKTKRIGCIVTIYLGVTDGIYFLLPVFTRIYFYETWLFWALTQTAANVVLLYCLIRDGWAAGRMQQ